MSEWTIPAGSLEVESGPTRDVTLQWATYYDAADQAGVSRLYGGIHIADDDFAGRRIGSACGIAAWHSATTRERSMARTDENQSALRAPPPCSSPGSSSGRSPGSVASWRSTLCGRPSPSRLCRPRASSRSRRRRASGVYDGDFTFFVGGGVVVDCSDDGLPDLFRGRQQPGGPVPQREPDRWRAAVRSRPASATDLTEVAGAYPVDIDGDAVMDLAVLRVGENVLLRGLGDCRFERANEAWGFDGGDDWTAAFSATWRVREAADPGDRQLPRPGRHPAAGDVRRQRARATLGRRGDVRRADPAHAGYCTLSVLFSDWGRKGQRDLRMANDRHYYTDGEEQLWRIREGEPPRPYTEAE